MLDAHPTCARTGCNEVCYRPGNLCPGHGGPPIERVCAVHGCKHVVGLVTAFGRLTNLSVNLCWNHEGWVRCPSCTPIGTWHALTRCGRCGGRGYVVHLYDAEKAPQRAQEPREGEGGTYPLARLAFAAPANAGEVES